MFTVQGYGHPTLFTFQLNTAFFHRAVQRRQGLEHSLNALKNTTQRQTSSRIFCSTFRIFFDTMLHSSMTEHFVVYMQFINI